jgi:hypothetical protein
MFSKGWVAQWLSRHSCPNPGGRNDEQTRPYRGARSVAVTSATGYLSVYSVQGHSVTTAAVSPYTRGECVAIRGVRVVEGDKVLRATGINPGASGRIEGFGKVSRAPGIALGSNGMILLDLERFYNFFPSRE